MSAGGTRASSPRSSRTCRVPTCGLSGRRCSPRSPSWSSSACFVLYPLALVAAAIAVPLLFILYFLRRRRVRGRAGDRHRGHGRVGRARRGGVGARRPLGREQRLAPPGEGRHPRPRLARDRAAARRACADARRPALSSSVQEVRRLPSTGSSSARRAHRRSSAPRRSRTPRASCTSASASPVTRPLWIARLLTLGVTIPVLGAGVVGATCGAFWLRLRSPLPDGRGSGSSGRRSRRW